ncbi:uncharacterized protein LOC112693458 [Sipha flava]|uniref:Uncharacterized protein LOC112693458 n=1 Tax=Sipha flava TaxID=143950 RepID=A0A8B8GMW7_9HEMI|nr:uncharacterized protein LOC112693458 [Sipha flava]
MVLRSSGIALVYSVAEYCATVWVKSVHCTKVDTQLNQKRVYQPYFKLRKNKPTSSPIQRHHRAFTKDVEIQTPYMGTDDPVVLELRNLKRAVERIREFDKSWKLFQRFKISFNFLREDPSTWKALDEYIQAKEILSALKVVNDTAERGVKLMEEYNEKFTKNEDEKQFILQVVREYRQQYPGFSREISKKTYAY